MFGVMCFVVCVWCDVFCNFVVVGRPIFTDIDRFILCFLIICSLVCSMFHWLIGNLVHC